MNVALDPVIKGPTFTPPDRKQSLVARSTRSRVLPDQNISTFNRISTETPCSTVDHSQPQELHLTDQKNCPNKRGHLYPTAPHSWRGHNSSMSSSRSFVSTSSLSIPWITCLTD